MGEQWILNCYLKQREELHCGLEHRTCRGFAGSVVRSNWACLSAQDCNRAKRVKKPSDKLTAQTLVTVKCATWCKYLLRLAKIPSVKTPTARRQCTEGTQRNSVYDSDYCVRGFGSVSTVTLSCTSLWPMSTNPGCFELARPIVLSSLPKLF